MHRITILVAVVFASAAITADAMTLARVEKTCPIGGERFTAVEAMSGTQFGMGFDRMPLGPTPAPWPVAKCPSNGLVMFKDFSKQELAKLASIVASAEYQRLQKTETPYYLIAHLQRALGAAGTAVADALLQATWEARGDDRYPRYAAEALSAIEDVLRTAKLDADERASWGQIAGELERRLGKMDAARSRFTTLLADATMAKSKLGPVLRQELVLVEANNSDFAVIEPEPGKK